MRGPLQNREMPWMPDDKRELMEWLALTDRQTVLMFCLAVDQWGHNPAGLGGAVLGIVEELRDAGRLPPRGEAAVELGATSLGVDVRLAEEV